MMEIPDIGAIRQRLERVNHRVKGLLDAEGIFLYDDEVFESI